MKVARVVGFVLLAVSVVYFVLAISRYAGEMPAIAWNTTTLLTLGVAVPASLATYAIGGLAWHLWLKAVGEPSRPSIAIALFAMSQLAKYVPGSVAQHIARVAIGKRYGLGAQGMVITFGLEAAWTLITGLAVGATGIMLSARELIDGVAMPSPLVITIITLLAALTPSAAIWLIGKRRPAFLDRWLGDNQITHPDWRTLATCFLLYCVNLTICGLVIDLFAGNVFGAPSNEIVAATGVFAIAWAMGFIALVSPAGIGVREAILLAGLTPVYGAGTALGVAILFRIVTSVGDGLGSVIGFVAERRLNSIAAREANLTAQ